MIRVLVVEDSPAIREFLIYILGSDSDVEVVGKASNGEEAIEAVKRLRPEVITMDIHMPKMDGLETTRRIMETFPTPIVIVSGSSAAKEVAINFRALEAGALAVVARPHGIGHAEFEVTAKELVQTVKLMSEVKVVRRWPRLSKKPILPPQIQVKKSAAEVRVIAIGGSTGGPIVLQTILSGLPKNLPVPILIVQHMANGFVQGFVEWLNGSSAIPVSIATAGELLAPRKAYIAPDARQMAVAPGNRIVLNEDEHGNGLRPSVSYLFRSVVQVFGKNAVGVLLTGMGKDGARELKLMKESGAITIVQDKESSVVYGMPGEAIKLDAATYVLPPERISQSLADLASRH